MYSTHTLTEVDKHIQLQNLKLKNDEFTNVCLSQICAVLHNDVLWKTRAQSSYQVHVNAGKSNSRPSAPTKGLASRLSFSVSRQDSLHSGISMYCTCLGRNASVK
jgi:hypothetical protein